MKNRTFLVSVVVLLAALVFLLIGRPAPNGIDKALPHVATGQAMSIDGLVRVDEESSVTSLERVETGLSAVFIMKPSCFYCEENLLFWAKLKRIYKNQLDAYGVILSEVSTEDATEFLRSKGLNFPLYSPKDLERFKFQFNVKFNLPQTVILDKGVVIYSKAGVLEAKDFFKIKKITEESIQNES